LCGIRVARAGQEADGIARDSISSCGCGDNLGHALGHSFGLEVPESPGLSSKSSDVLKRGMCVTVEPGIYIDGGGGVRIEDGALVTEDGLKKLTHSSKELFII